MGATLVQFRKNTIASTGFTISCWATFHAWIVTRCWTGLFLPQYIFSRQDVILGLGQDGLIANLAKYVKGQPIIGINPDPERNSGVLLPFSLTKGIHAMNRTLEGKATVIPVSMAEARFNDGQRLIAFNDFYIGTSGHTSARYRLSVHNRSEDQSSSGIIVSTGAGATGWMSSIFNMARGLFKFQGIRANLSQPQLGWEADQLLFAVREPYKSPVSEANICFGIMEQSEQLKVRSYMTGNGVVFSDGIEADRINFNMGGEVTIGLAPEKANLVR